VTTTQARLEAGDALREDLERVEMELARAKVELQRAQSRREQALLALASAMGDATLSVKSLAGALDATFDIPTLETLAANLASRPGQHRPRQTSAPATRAWTWPKQSASLT